MLKAEMEVKIKPGTMGECGNECQDCTKCMKPPIILKKGDENDSEERGTLIPWDNNGKGGRCSMIPKDCLIPVNTSWRKLYEKRN